jgi:outer membrane lipoprotein-sorting protein
MPDRIYDEAFMKKILFAVLVTMAVIIPVSIQALTGDEAVEKFKARFYSAKTMKGVISMSYSSGEMYTGSFKYMTPGKFDIKLSVPSGKEIVTNGKKLWVYDKSNNICGVQDVDKTLSGGVAGFINGYMAIATPSGAADTIIKLKSPNKFYRDISITLDSSFMIKKAVFRNEKGDGFAVTFSNVTINEQIAPGVFDFSVPPNAQLVKNPLDVR